MLSESNLEMKEENQMLREQDVIRNELLARYEKRNEDMIKEVSSVVLGVCFRHHVGGVAQCEWDQGAC